MDAELIRNMQSNRKTCRWPMLLLALLFTGAAPSGPKLLPEVSLLDAKGEPFSTATIRDSDQLAVLIFTASTCPITTCYLERIKGTWYNFRDQKVRFYAVGGNSDDTLSSLKKAFSDREMEMPLLWDPKHTLAKVLGIEYTPLAVVLGPEGQILYRGRLDDSWRDESKVKQRYLTEAITAALTGKPSPDQLDQAFLGSHLR